VNGYSTNKDDYLKRLRRIEGQVRGLQRMVEEDNYGSPDGDVGHAAAFEAGRS
jgi:hypothetical protein